MIMAPTSKSRKASKGLGKKQAQLQATGKKRPHDENDLSDTSRHPRKSAHIPDVNILSCKVSALLHYEVTHTKCYWKDALEREKANNASLRDQLEEANNHGGARDNIEPTDHEMIPRPAGMAGTNFSIQVVMGLSGRTKKYDKYKAIQVCPNSMAWKLSLTIIAKT
jgi:hypothetical protein